MAWKISVNVERDPEALTAVQGMIYAAAKAQGATDLEACSAALSLREAIQTTGAARAELEPEGTQASPVQIELECDEETLILFARDCRLPSASESAVRH